MKTEIERQEESNRMIAEFDKDLDKAVNAAWVQGIVSGFLLGLGLFLFFL